MKWIAVGAAILAAAYTADRGHQVWLLFLLAALVIAVLGPDNPAVSVNHNHFEGKDI
jgi:hypothetical protein